jgi:protein involved in polysaccharide export with SLBB domain
MQLSDVLMQAGGFGANSAMDRMSVIRRNDRIWDGDALRTAMIEGRTVDQLSLYAGDIIDVPSKANTWQTVRSLWYVVPVVTLILRLLSL